jgi:hypothetical protein
MFEHDALEDAQWDAEWGAWLEATYDPDMPREDRIEDIEV